MSDAAHTIAAIFRIEYTNELFGNVRAPSLTGSLPGGESPFMASLSGGTEPVFLKSALAAAQQPSWLLTPSLASGSRIATHAPS